MKKLFTFLALIGMFVFSQQVWAQNLEEEAEKQTHEMAKIMKLNETEALRLKNFNLNRLHQIASLANLREQDNRYLDLRLDLIEEEYASVLYNTFTPKQYAGYKEYRKEIPYTYASLMLKNNTLKNENTIAVLREE